MFVGGLVTNSNWMSDHAGKALIADTTIAITTFVIGILMMTHVLPGAAFGAIPSSLGFILMAASVVAGAIKIMHADNRRNIHVRTHTQKDRNKEFKEELEQIGKDSAELDNTRRILEDVELKLKNKDLTPHEKLKLENLRKSIKLNLQIKD